MGLKGWRGKGFWQEQRQKQEAALDALGWKRCWSLVGGRVEGGQGLVVWPAVLAAVDRAEATGVLGSGLRNKHLVVQLPQGS